ncbi:MAG TPA: hypothetical protein VGE69_13265 [Pseudomonadales bacterium]
MFSRKIILLSLAVASTTLQAAEEFPNGLVPADVAAEFAGGGTLYRGLPDGFPDLVLPARLGLRLIGTHQRNPYSQTILIQSAAGPADLRETLLSMLQMQGWHDLGSAPIGAVDPVFLQLCHDIHGTMTVTMRSNAAGTQLQVRRTVYPQQFTRMPCAEERARSQAASARYAYFGQLLPVLEVPDGTLAPQPSVGIRNISSSFSGDSVRMEREGSVSVPDTTAADVYEHFAEQLREQGWVADSSATGELTASSTWLKEVTVPGAAASERVVLTFNVFAATEDAYGVTLVLRSSSRNPGGDYISGLPLF